MKADWKLYLKDKLVVDDKDIILEKDNNKLIYKDKVYKGVHIIDMDEEIYERRYDDNIFKIKFKDKVCEVRVDGKDLVLDVLCSFKKTTKRIELCYELDKDNKRIVIDLKEDV